MRWIISDMRYTFLDITDYCSCVKSTKPHTGQKPRRRKPTEATLRVGATMALPAVLRSLGANPAEVLAEEGFDPTLFDDPENLITYAARGHLLSRCVARTGCRHLGLLIGQQGGLQSLGLMGLLVKYSPDVETALRNFIRYTHLHVRGAATTLEVSGNSAMLSYEIHQLRVEGTDQIGDGAVAVLFNIMRALCGPDWKPAEVRFAHIKPKDVGPFRQFFMAPLRFDAEQYALVFSTYWLNRRLTDTDAELSRVLQTQVDALAARHGNDFPEQVRSVLRAALVSGRAKADQIAALFSMHARTLNRRLNDYGTGFQELVDEGRFEIARQMLENSATAVHQIAAMLDYADASAFGRAFRRWSGTTPAQWRATRGRAM